MCDEAEKLCSRCREKKPLSAFPKRKTACDGRRAECRECVRKSRDTPEYREYMRTYLKQYAQERKVSLSSYKQLWHVRNKDRLNTLRDPEKVRVWKRNSYLRRREFVLNYHKARYLRNCVSVRARSRRYTKEHPDVVRRSQFKRRVRAGAPPDKEHLRLLGREDRCTYCENTLIPGEGRSIGVLTRLNVDHVMPIHRGGTNASENLVAACGACNLAKGAKTLAEWVSFGAPPGALRLLEERRAAGVDT